MPKTVYVVEYTTNLQNAHRSVYTDKSAALIGYSEGKSALAHIVKAAGKDTSNYKAYQQRLDERGMQFVVTDGENTIGMCQLQEASLFVTPCRADRKRKSRRRKRLRKHSKKARG